MTSSLSLIVGSVSAVCWATHLAIKQIAFALLSTCHASHRSEHLRHGLLITSSKMTFYVYYTRPVLRTNSTKMRTKGERTGEAKIPKNLRTYLMEAPITFMGLWSIHNLCQSLPCKNVTSLNFKCYSPVMQLL